MLVLTRKPSQRIFVGDDVTITVVRIDGNTVRIGIDAPGGVQILREEIKVKEQLKQQQKEEANEHSGNC